MNPENIAKEIKKVGSLPTLPGVVAQLCAMVDSPDTSASDIANLISKDQVLAARILKLVNSAFYGFPGRISSVSQAYVLLGFNVVKGLSVSVSVFDLMKGGLEDLWRHSLACSTVAGHVARALGEQDPEEIAVAALLHDIGKVAIWTKFPEEMEKVISQLQATNKSLIELEEEFLGITHVEVSGLLAEKWNLPENLREPITCHHQPWRSKKHTKRTYMVHLANIIAIGMGYSFSKDTYVHSMDKRLWDALELNDDLMDRIMENVVENIDEIDEFNF